MVIFVFSLCFLSVDLTRLLVAFDAELALEATMSTRRFLDEWRLSKQLLSHAHAARQARSS